jgi:hypothetical protein
VTTPLLGAGAKRNATPTLTIPPFELSCHRHATAPPDATHVLRKTTSEGPQAADMVGEGPKATLIKSTGDKLRALIR